MEGYILKQIYKTYEKPIYNYILLMMQNEQIAEELTQKTFI